MPASISSAVAIPSCSAKIASLIIGHRMRLTAKPGLFFAVIGTFPTRLAKASALATVSSEVCRPRISSSSAITGTGLKKCMPMKRSGRSVAVASLVIEIDEVLVAIMPREFSDAAEILQDLQLQLLILGRRLDRKIAICQFGLVGRSEDATERHFTVGRGHLLLLDQALQARADGGKPALDRCVCDIRHHHLQAGRRTDLGNPVAHRARPDHAYDFNHCQNLLFEPSDGVVPVRLQARQSLQAHAQA